MVISGLGFFGVNVEESNSVAGTAILGRIKPVTSILAEEILAWFTFRKYIMFPLSFAWFEIVAVFSD